MNVHISCKYATVAVALFLQTAVSVSRETTSQRTTLKESLKSGAGTDVIIQNQRKYEVPFRTCEALSRCKRQVYDKQGKNAKTYFAKNSQQNTTEFSRSRYRKRDIHQTTQTSVAQPNRQKAINNSNRRNPTESALNIERQSNTESALNRRHQNNTESVRNIRRRNNNGYARDIKRRRTTKSSFTNQQRRTTESARNTNNQNNTKLTRVGRRNRAASAPNRVRRTTKSSFNNQRQSSTESGFNTKHRNNTEARGNTRRGNNSQTTRGIRDRRTTKSPFNASRRNNTEATLNAKHGNNTEITESATRRNSTGSASGTKDQKTTKSSLNSQRQNTTESSVNSRQRSSTQSFFNTEGKGDSRKRQNSTSTNSPSPTESSENEQTTTEGYNGWNIIFPGTKWCGAGATAEKYEDLGTYSDTDKCCRAHDLCNDTLAPGATKNNLTNTSPFTKLSCKCDDDFYNCLEQVNSMPSNKIGNIYFNILRRECYQEDYPETTNCRTYRFMRIGCLEYERNISVSKVYQWVKAKTYKKLPIPG